MKPDKPISERQAAKIISDINSIVVKSAPGSALRGLTVTAQCFAALLDVYAQPNPGNSQGMCDDPQSLRKYFADIIVSTPRLQKKDDQKAATA